MNPRMFAAQALAQVLSQGTSLSEALDGAALKSLPERDRALAQELCYGVLRWLPSLETIAKALLRKPFREKDTDVRCLLLVGLYQLVHLRVPDHAAVSQTVAAVHGLKKPWAVGLINAVLRAYLRDPERLRAIAEREPAALGHPNWLREALQKAWPEHWRAILQANTARPPLWLRVNTRRLSRAHYLSQLRERGIAANPSPHAAEAIVLEKAVGVEQIPGFAAGRVSLQDAAAQLAAKLLAVEDGDRVLDACAAPGGKTGHLLETYPRAGEILALDQNPKRLQLIEDNLNRLGLAAQLRAADAASPTAWWDGRPFQRILLDTPCSATGVIRRHPDVKWRRTPGDIVALVQQQHRLLEGLWPLLASGGILLYATCSVLPEENHRQVARFLSAHQDAREHTLQAPWGHVCSHGRQILPGEESMDGFYYACLKKVTNGE